MHSMPWSWFVIGLRQLTAVHMQGEELLSRLKAELQGRFNVAKQISKALAVGHVRQACARHVMHRLTRSL